MKTVYLAFGLWFLMGCGGTSVKDPSAVSNPIWKASKGGNKAKTASKDSASNELHALAALPPALPTEVELNLSVVGLTHVSSASFPFPTFTSEVLLMTSWSDTRLAFDAERTGGDSERFVGHAADALLDRIWSPDLSIENEEGERQIEHREVEIDPDGSVRLLERFSVTAHAELDLRRFPFDRQDLELRMASFSWDRDHLRLSVGSATFDPDYHNLDWEVQRLSAQTEQAARYHSAAPVDIARFYLHIERQSGFYIYKLLLPLLLIVTCSWSAFFLRAEQSAGRMQRTFIALLTIVAYHHIVAEHLPRISYFTFIDAVVYAAFVSVLAVLFQTVIIHNADSLGNTERARAVERRARWLHPVLFFTAISIIWIYFHV